MAPPSQTDLDVIVESKTVEIVEEGGALSESTTQEPATGPPQKGSKNNPWIPTLRPVLCLPMRMTY